MPFTFSSLFQRISIREEMLFSNWNECRTGSQKNDSDATEIFFDQSGTLSTTAP